MSTALERARDTVLLHSLQVTREQMMQNKAHRLFTTFVTWFDAQPSGSLEHITDFPGYPECRGVRISDGPARWTIGKEPARKDIPNAPVIVYFEYWGEEGKREEPRQYTESYLLYRDHIETGDANGGKIYSKSVFDELTNQINKITVTDPIVATAQGKE